nr:cellulase family glycosylhydrolase [uncultured Rhodopila sp.]
MSGTFSVSNGQIIAPDGQPFTAEGVGVVEGNQPSAATLQSDFPGINFVRLAIYDYQSPASLAAYVDQLTSAGIVVEIEDHSNNANNTGGGEGTIFTGQALTTELNWYSSIASTFANNPNVWFGTNNEPSEVNSSGNTDPAALSTWQQQTYNAIRDTGNNSPIMVEMNSLSPATTGLGYTPSVYAGMSNIVWDVHYYGWLSGYSTDQNTVTQTLDGMIAGAQTFTSANGTVPVIIGEYGTSTNGSTPDPNADQVVQAVLGTGLGNSAWLYGDGGDGLVNSDGSLSYYGQQIAAGIASASGRSGAAAVVSSPAVVGAAPAAVPAQVSAPASANDTVVQAGSSATITDAGGNAWSIDGAGQVALNGVADTSTWNVTELAYVNGTIWSENTSALWWEKTSLTAPWSPNAGTFSSPLADASSGTGGSAAASANDTVVQAGSSGTITDAGGNAWSIDSAGQVALNGVADTSTWNVTELAYVNGTIWSENTSALWWEKTSPSAPWSPNAGTFSSPLAAPSPSSISVATAGTAASVDPTAIGTTTLGDETFVLNTPEVVAVTLGAAASTLNFVGLSGITLAAGSGDATVTADGGGNTFTAGAGSLTVTGGSGADAYVYQAGDGALTVGDFATAKGDTLTVDQSLQGSMVESADANGGTLLTFGGAGSIDIANVASLASSAIQWK